MNLNTNESKEFLEALRFLIRQELDNRNSTFIKRREVIIKKVYNRYNHNRRTVDVVFTDDISQTGTLKKIPVNVPYNIKENDRAMLFYFDKPANGWIGLLVTYTSEDYVPINTKAVDSERLGGKLPEEFVLSSDARLFNARPASDVSAWAKSPTKPSYTFSEIGSKPDTLAGYGITDAYTKTQVDATYATKDELNNRVPIEIKGTYNLNNLLSVGFYTINGNMNITNAPVTGAYSVIVTRSANGNYFHQMIIQDGTYNIYLRYYNGSTWSSWEKIATKDEIPIVPTWALKPSLDIDDIPTIPHTKLSGVINYQNLEAILSDYRTADVADNLYATKDELNNRVPIEIKGTYDCNNLITPGFYTITGNVGITHAPASDSFSIIVSRTDIPANGTYIHQLAMQDSTHNVYVRYYNGSTWSEWRKLLYADEKAYDTTRVDGIEVKYYTQSQFASITPVAGVHYVIYEN